MELTKEEKEQPASENLGKKEKDDGLPIAMEEMTSKDFYLDPLARHQFQSDILKDEITMMVYKEAICGNQHLFKGKTVLDVGCGTGILSMFAAKAGASKVIAVEWSAIADCATRIVKENNLDHVITVIRGKLEELELELPDGVKKVDIIISNWMGKSLFVESRLDAVLFARDKWLKSDGILFPDKCSLFITAADEGDYQEGRKYFWGDVYGFDMDCLAQATFKVPLHDIVDPIQISTGFYRLAELNLYTVSKECQSFAAPFKLVFRENMTATALVTFFAVEFSKSHKPTGLSTSPWAPSTHWEQTLLYLNGIISANKGETLTGEFAIKKNSGKNTDMDFEIKVDFEGNLGSLHEFKSFRFPGRPGNSVL